MIQLNFFHLLWLLSRPAREAEQARKQIEAGTFAGQEYMLECLDVLVRRGGG